VSTGSDVVQGPAAERAGLDKRFEPRPLGPAPLGRLRLPRVRPLQVVGLLGFFAAWESASQAIGSNVVPSPLAVAQELLPILTHSAVIAAAGGGQAGLLPHLTYSVNLTLAGGFVGIVLGIAVGLLMGWSRHIRYFLEPPVEALRTVPALAAIPFFLIWFGPWPLTQFLVIVYYASLRLIIYTVEAIRNVPPVYVDFARTLGATRFQVYRTVVLPGIVPELVGGIRAVIATAWGIEVVAELMGSQFGVGRLFAVLSTILAANTIVTVIVWVSVVAVVMDLCFILLSRRLTRWMT
jgi:ABC-type nitrate/sulfonate/bicarbonate transport system permease component